jgi:hypothetical protein
MIDEKEAKLFKFLPSKKYPSDHLALLGFNIFNIKLYFKLTEIFKTNK